MTKFEQKVYDSCNIIPKGKVITYRDIAEHIGDIKCVRAVGNALARNPCLISTPCHRVVMVDGKVGGYINGVKEKIKLLKREGVIIINGRIDMNKYRYILNN